MRVLRQGATGSDVTAWQHFLIGQGFYEGRADGQFGPGTRAASVAFQSSQGLTADGVVGNNTFAAAMRLGFGAAEDPDNSDEDGPNWPPIPDFAPLTSTADRQRVFGAFQYESAPTSGNAEGIRILGGWVQENIVTATIPQLVGVQGASRSGAVSCHRLAAAPLVTLWEAWQEAGLISLVKTWAGSFAPRFIRGSRTTLSNHAFGTAFDINVAWNGLGVVPAFVGKTGSVRKLVPIANNLGWYWGGHYRTRPDGMHFELSVLR
jgi:hypothetical protein